MKMTGGHSNMFKNIVGYIKEHLIPISVILICLYAFYLRIMTLAVHSLWLDEASQLERLKGSFIDLIRAMPQGEFCSYLSGDFYLMYPFFKIFSYNRWGLAIPHIIATVIGFYLLYLICKRYFKSIWAYLITFTIVCFNLTLIKHATEIRPYAVLPTLALATLYLFLRIADSDFKMSVSKRIWATLFFIMVIWFHVYGIAMFMTSLIFSVLSKYKAKEYRIYLKDIAFFTGVILCITMPLWLYSVFGTHAIASRYQLPTFRYIPNPAHNLLGFLKGIFCNIVGRKQLYFLFIGIIIPFVFSYKDRFKQLLFLFVNILSPIGLILLAGYISNYSFMQRQFIWVMPLFAFFLGWAYDSFFTLLKKDGKERGK